MHEENSKLEQNNVALVTLIVNNKGDTNYAEWKRSLGARFIRAGGQVARFYWKIMDKPFEEEEKVHTQKVVNS